MRLIDLSVGTQLRLGLGLILTLVVAVEALSWFQISQIDAQMEALYEHPLHVRQALYELQTEVRAIQAESYAAEHDPSNQAAVDSGFEVHASHAMQQFDILYGAYLGPATDVDEARDAFIRFRRTPNDAAALEEHLTHISDFANARADSYYADANEHVAEARVRLGASVLFILAASMLVAGILLRNIRRPLVDLTHATDLYRKGHRDARSHTLANNEFGTLSIAFNAMADEINTELQVTERALRLSEVIIRDAEPHAFCGALLAALLEQTGSQIGAIYLLNNARTAFEHFESIGLGEGARGSFSAAGREGEFGSAVASRKIQHITDIPPDTRFAFTTVGGTFQPRAILTIPVLAADEVSAIISLASVRPYPASTLRLVQDVWTPLVVRLNGVLAFERTKALAQRLEEQNRELEAQQHALAGQAAELTAQNTELEQQKRQVDEASRLKTAFLSNMSHELRTPLNSVIALSGVLRRRLQKKVTDEEYSYLEIIERNGKSQLTLINDILDLARIEAGREEVQHEPFSLHTLTNELVEVVGPQAREKGLALENRVAMDLPAVFSDVKMCGHILQNLIANAVKFTERGHVYVTATLEERRVQIAVVDTGIGIAEDKRALVFEEFRQADDTTSRRYGGSGLGLSIARRYARLLGGDVELSSVLGEGSTFTLVLPRQAVRNDAPALAASTIAQPTALTGHGKRLLLVEDSEPAIIQMVEILGARGYRVDVARDGHAALAFLSNAVPDGMILDLMMPGIDGFQVLKEVRSRPQTLAMPVLILTAKHVSRAELSSLRANHISQLIQKGDTDKPALLDAIARMLTPTTPDSGVPSRRRKKPTRPGKPLVLVVEDNPDNLSAARALLEPDYEVIEASDGRVGVDEARLRAPDAILMDIAMPVLDGIQALAEIRSDEALKGIPVFAVTASAMTGQREQILSYGFDAYVSKPIDRAQLLEVLRYALDTQ